MVNPNESWQVEVNGEIYDTTFGELTVWIAESSLLVEDKVRKGNLRWLQAGMVPPLRPFFEAKANGTDPPAIQITLTDAAPEPAPGVNSTHNIVAESSVAEEPVYSNEEPAEDISDPEIDDSVCNVHPELESVYICGACKHGFCKSCPESFGASVKICPYCGAMCRLRKEVDQTAAIEGRIQNDIAGGFGFGDLGTAITYPFRYKSSLFFGGLIVAVLGYGQTAASMGSFFLIAAAFICFILSSAFVFGMVSHTLNNFAQGDIDSNYLAGLDDFSAWDNVIHPFLLFVGVYISSFGLVTLLVIGFAWFTMNSFSSQLSQQNTQMEALTRESAQSADHVAAVREKLVKQNEGRTDITVGTDGLTDAQRLTLVEEAEFQKVNDLANNYRKAQLESTIGKSSEAQNAEMQAIALSFVKSAGMFIILIGLALLWAFFYFPAACAVAGYTKSFSAAVNPLVGLDTIKHLGFDYVKILLMTIVLSVVSGIIGAILGLIFSPFDLPGMGNIPAKFVSSFIGFYSWIVFAVLLGLALYKNSDKLKLFR